MKSEEEKPPASAGWKVESERVLNVLHGLHIGDISDCKTTDVTHACEVLTHVFQLEELKPGIVGEMFSMLIPHFVRMHDKARINEMAQKRADAEGIGDKWKAAMAAANHPKQKDLFSLMVDIEMKSGGVTQADAIRTVAKVMRREEEDVRRNVNRQNSRMKKTKSSD